MEKPIDIFSGHERSSEPTHALMRLEYLDWLEGYGDSRVIEMMEV